LLVPGVQVMLDEVTSLRVIFQAYLPKGLTDSSSFFFSFTFSEKCEYSHYSLVGHYIESLPPLKCTPDYSNEVLLGFYF